MDQGRAPVILVEGCGHVCQPPNGYGYPSPSRPRVWLAGPKDMGTVWQCDGCGQIWRVVMSWGYAEWRRTSERKARRLIRKAGRP